MIYQVKAKISQNKKVKADYHSCWLDFKSIARASLPGQFLDVSFGATALTLLRRPFSIHKVNGNRLEILYEVVGEGSRLLSRKKAGEYIDVLGPLGTGFVCPASNTQHQMPILVAGGMGVAPLLFLAERLPKSKGLVLIGAKTKGQVLCEKEFKALGCEVKIATDDGSLGFKGYVSELLKDILGNKRYAISDKRIYACGPRPMLKKVCRISGQYDISAQVSLEEHMACGFGACLGCAVNTIDGYKRVCKDGPVFWANQIIWGGRT